jgi:hypothetical protein
VSCVIANLKQIIPSAGHCLVIRMKCKNGHVICWAGSEKFEDGIYQVNKQMICSLETVGGDVEHYLELCTVMGFGAVSHTTITEWLKEVDRVIVEEANTSMEEAIREENDNVKQQQQLQREKQLQIQQQH